MRILVQKEGFVASQKEAVVLKAKPSELFIRFSPSFDFGEEPIEYAVVQARREGDISDQLQMGSSIPCNLVALPAARAISDDPFDLSWWRGGLAVITDIKIAGR